MDEVDPEEFEREVLEAAGSNPKWINVELETVQWLVRTVQRLVSLDEQAVDEWNSLVLKSDFHNLTRQMGEEFNHQRMLKELQSMAESADIYDGELHDNEEAG